MSVNDFIAAVLPAVVAEVAKRHKLLDYANMTPHGNNNEWFADVATTCRHAIAAESDDPHSHISELKKRSTKVYHDAIQEIKDEIKLELRMEMMHMQPQPSQPPQPHAPAKLPKYSTGAIADFHADGPNAFENFAATHSRGHMLSKSQAQVILQHNELYQRVNKSLERHGEGDDAYSTDEYIDARANRMDEQAIQEYRKHGDVKLHGDDDAQLEQWHSAIAKRH